MGISSIVDEKLAEFLDSLTGGFSGVVLLQFGGEEHHLAVRGYAHRPTHTTNTATTRFGIASGTKGFTATAVLQLIEEGRLAFNTRISDLLPGEFPRFADEITVRHLLTHTSGIPDYCDEEQGCNFEQLWSELPVYVMREVRDYLPLFRDLSMKSPPGSRFSYSNSGFLVLGLIIEKLEGRNFRSCIDDRVFAPAAMGQSGFFVADALPAQTARGYIENKDGTLRSNVFAVPAIGGPDGGAYVTAADMLRFWESLFDGSLLSPAMIDSIRTITVGPTDGRLRYSLGFWRADSWSRNAWFVLMGADPGVSFVSAYSPDTRDGFVILSNTDNSAFSLLKPIRELFRED